MSFFNANISRVEVAFRNFLESAIRLHPLPWRASQAGEKWTVVASDGATVIFECADWAQAQTIADEMNRYPAVELQAETPI